MTKQFILVLFFILISIRTSFSQGQYCIFTLNSGYLTEGIYYGFENRLQVMVENNKCENVKLKGDGCEIKKIDPCTFSVKPFLDQTVYAFYIYLNDILFDSLFCNRQYLSVDYLCIKPRGCNGEYPGNLITQSIEAYSFKAPDYKFNILNFELLLFRKEKLLYSEQISGSRFTEKAWAEIGKLMKDDRVVLLNINVSADDGVLRCFKYFEEVIR